MPCLAAEIAPEVGEELDFELDGLGVLAHRVAAHDLLVWIFWLPLLDEYILSNKLMAFRWLYF